MTSLLPINFSRTRNNSFQPWEKLTDVYKIMLPMKFSEFLTVTDIEMKEVIENYDLIRAKSRLGLIKKIMNLMKL